MLIERASELKTLQGLLETARLGRGSVVLLTGEAGIGKTSLVEAFAADVHNCAQIASGMCDALFTPRPLGPVLEIAASLGGECAELASMRSGADRLFPAILSAASSPDRPGVVIIEDIHWADFGTLDFLRFLGRRISALSIVLVATYRDDEIDQAHPLHQVLGDLPSKSVHHITLKPLSFDGIAQLNHSKKFSTDEILSVSGGNPFFVTELLASQGNEITVAPRSVREVVNGRLNRITAPERSFLETASLIPVPIDLTLLDGLFEEPVDILAKGCIGHGLLKQDGDGLIRFRHELARLATADRLTRNEQTEIHEKLLATLLNRDDPPLDQLVHHAAGALNSAAVLEYAPIAARRAAEIGAHREATGHLATALDFVSDADTELAATLYENWAYEAGLSLQIDDDVIDARQHAVSLWRALGRTDKVGENLRWLSRLYWYRGEASKALQFLDRAVEIFENEGASAEKAMAFSMRSQFHMLNDRMPEAIAWGERAIDMAAAFDSDDVLIHALNNVGSAKLLRGSVEGLADMERSLQLARKLGRHEDVARVYTNLSEYAVEFRDFALAEQVLSDGIAFDTEHDLDSWTFYLIGWLAHLRLAQGRLTDAETIAQGVMDRRNQTLLMKLPAQIVLAKARVRLGRPGAHTALSEALRAALSTGESQYIVPVRTTFVEAAALDGTPSVAEEHLNAVLSVGKDSVMNWRMAELWFWGLRCGLDLERRMFGDLPPPYQHIEAGELDAAARAFGGLGMKYHEAYLRMLCGGHTDIISAHRIAVEMQARPLVTQCRNIAIERGIQGALAQEPRGPYSAARSHPMGLTNREQEVLRELAVGATNQEIADALSRSRRTVENHVSSILKKLNATSRTDVILRIQNEPWLLPNT
ncbi:ATP-binding protein [Hyphomonas johnsonii]|nr:helix-turn-helix transcriptional regulator [Hyphomonas johnsonii]